MYYNRIDLGEGNYVTKCNNIKKCIVCYYWYFNHGFKCQESVFNGCHGLLILCINMNDITIITNC